MPKTHVQRLAQQGATGFISTSLRIANRKVRHAINVRQREEAERRQEIELWNQKIKEGIAKRLPLAKKGLERIMQIGQDPAVQRLMHAMLMSPYHLRFVLYKTSRPSGDAWDYPGEGLGTGRRDIMIQLHLTHIEVLCGSELTFWEIYYKELQPGIHVIRSYDGYPSKQITIDDFLTEIATPVTANLALLEHPDQRAFEWEPEAVAFQVFVSCARRTALKKYLDKGLERAGSTY